MSEVTYAALTILTGLILAYLSRSINPRHLPPSLPEKWLSGNLHQLPRVASWLTFMQWSKDFGSPVVSYRMLKRRVIILNTVKAVTDLLQLRAGIYSDRPFSWMHNGLVNRRLALFTISSENPRFKVYRRLVQTGLNPRAVQSYKDILERERNILLRSLATPSDKHLFSYIKQNAAGIILAVAYGWTVEDTDDQLIALFEEAIKIQGQTTQPGRWMVDLIPALCFVPNWLPGASFKRIAKEFRERFSKIENTGFLWAKEQIASGYYIESFTSRHLQELSTRDSTPEDGDIVKWAAAALYGGGADTAVAALCSFVLLMVQHPDVQLRVQAEIDRVIGSGRLPTLQDQDNMVYLNAVLKEVLRFAPVAPLGLSHRLIKDDEYLGYYMPKGAIIIANIWACMRDPTIYPDPDKFDPDRFLPPNEQMDSRKLVFGFGQRTCPGTHLAEATMFLNAASLLAAFTITKTVDETGKEMEPTGEYVDIPSYPVNHVKPFECRIIPRHPGLIPVI